MVKFSKPSIYFLVVSFIGMIIELLLSVNNFDLPIGDELLEGIILSAEVLVDIIGFT